MRTPSPPPSLSSFSSPSLFLSSAFSFFLSSFSFFSFSSFFFSSSPFFSSFSSYSFCSSSSRPPLSSFQPLYRTFLYKSKFIIVLHSRRKYLNILCSETSRLKLGDHFSSPPVTEDSQRGHGILGLTLYIYLFILELPKDSVSSSPCVACRSGATFE